jgi:HD-like signal output (HDOD) protein
MVEMQADRAKLVDVFRRTGADSKGIPACNMIEAEQLVFGATHEDFGAGLCEQWKFPKSFAMVTGYHHKPMSLPSESRTLTAIIYVADRLAADTGQGFRQDLMDTNVDPAVLDHLKLGSDKLTELRANVIAQAKDLGGMLS